MRLLRLSQLLEELSALVGGRPTLREDAQTLRDVILKMKESLGPKQAEFLAQVEKAAPGRDYMVGLQIVNYLHSTGGSGKSAMFVELKNYLRAAGVKEITAYPGYPASELGPSKIEEKRVNSPREKGHIVKVLRPGFTRNDGAVLQKVQAEVSR